MYGAPCPLVGVRGFCVRWAALPRADTGAVWRLSRCSLVFCFSLEVTRACAVARWVSGAGGVSFMS